MFFFPVSYTFWLLNWNNFADARHMFLTIKVPQSWCRAVVPEYSACSMLSSSIMFAAGSDGFAQSNAVPLSVLMSSVCFELRFTFVSLLLCSYLICTHLSFQPFSPQSLPKSVMSLSATVSASTPACGKRWQQSIMTKCKVFDSNDRLCFKLVSRFEQIVILLLLALL